MEKSEMYGVPLEVLTYRLVDEKGQGYTSTQIEDDDELEVIYKQILEDFAKYEKTTVDKLDELFTLEVDEEYKSLQNTDTVDITEDTFYLYDAMARVGSRESDVVTVWAVTKGTEVKNADGELEETKEQILLLKAEAVATPMGLAEFVTTNKTETAKNSSIKRIEQKTISFADLKKVAEQKKEEAKQTNNVIDLRGDVSEDTPFNEEGTTSTKDTESLGSEVNEGIVFQRPLDISKYVDKGSLDWEFVEVTNEAEVRDIYTKALVHVKDYEGVSVTTFFKNYHVIAEFTDLLLNQVTKVDVRDSVYELLLVMKKLAEGVTNEVTVRYYKQEELTSGQEGNVVLKSRVSDKSEQGTDEDEEGLYTYEEVKVLVDKAYQDGYQKALEELG